MRRRRFDRPLGLALALYVLTLPAACGRAAPPKLSYPRDTTDVIAFQERFTRRDCSLAEITGVLGPIDESRPRFPQQWVIYLKPKSDVAKEVYLETDPEKFAEDSRKRDGAKFLEGIDGIGIRYANPIPVSFARLAAKYGEPNQGIINDDPKHASYFFNTKGEGLEGQLVFEVERRGETDVRPVTQVAFRRYRATP